MIWDARAERDMLGDDLQVKYMKSSRRISVVFAGLLAVLAAASCVNPPIASAQSASVATAPAQATPQSSQTTKAQADFVKAVQSQLLQRGINAHVNLQAEDKDTLRIEWQRMNSSLVYSLITSPALRDNAKPIGLKTVVFTDGGGLRDCRGLAKAQCEERWDYDLKRESMIWRPSLVW